MSTKQQKGLEPFEFLKQLEEHCRGKTFIFRGTTVVCSKEAEKEKKDGVNSRLYYWGKGSDKTKQDDDDKSKRGKTAQVKLFNENYKPPNMEKEIVERARHLFTSGTSIRSILTSLQHLGGHTNLIDFSRSLNVALFLPVTEILKTRVS